MVELPLGREMNQGEFPSDSSFIELWKDSASNWFKCSKMGLSCKYDRNPRVTRLTLVHYDVKSTGVTPGAHPHLVNYTNVTGLIVLTVEKSKNY